MIWISTGTRPSNGAKALSALPGFRRLRPGSVVGPKDVVINWGSGLPFALPGNPKIVNDPAAVKVAANKLVAFRYLVPANVETVEWTANKAVAQEWLDGGAVVVVRKTLTGHSGAGIMIVEAGQQLDDAPLYTRYVFKTKEFRIHATQSKVIDTQRKVRDKTRETLSWKVRSHENGFLFQRQNIEPNAVRDKLAIDTIKALSLDFGAVDIVEDRKGKLYVLEVNTAPGLEGQSVEVYGDMIKEFANA